MIDDRIVELFDTIDTQPSSGFKEKLLAELTEALETPGGEGPELAVMQLPTDVEERRRSRWPRVLAVAGVAAAAAVMVLVVSDRGQPGDGVGVAEQPLSEDPFHAAYLAEVDEINERFDNELSELMSSALFPGDAPTSVRDRIVRELGDVATAARPLIGTWRVELQALDPPPGLRADHDRFLADLEDLSADLGAISDLVTRGELDAAFGVWRAREVRRSTYGIEFGDEFRATLPPGVAPAAPVVGAAAADTDAEAAYLRAVSEAGNIFVEANATFAQTFSEGEQTQARFFASLEAAGVGTPWTRALRTLELIEPPSWLSDVHAALLEEVALLADIDMAIGDAAAAEDIVQFEIHNHRMELANITMVLRIPQRVMAALSTAPPGFVSPPPGDEFLGAYGDEVHRIVQAAVAVQGFDRFAGPGFNAHTVFTAFATEEAKLATAEALSAEIAALLEPLLADLDALEPPSAVADDHAAIVTFVQGSLARHRAQIEAATAGDIDELDRLQAETPVHLCALLRDVSITMQPTVTAIDSDRMRRECEG